MLLCVNMRFMQVYLVGGAVRDELLGRSVHERDWVVVGATPEEMQKAGYKAVGREFPVFLHPKTKEEYALARQERKTGPGYRGFSVHFSPDVTLEQDLLRRDLTINAIARDGNGTLVDPYGGRLDLEGRWLRHVSPAFVEDPVRVLRVARFAARFACLGFCLAPETAQLLREMAHNGEVDALVPERVWREMERALQEPNPEVFFDVLGNCGALKVILPELAWSDSDRSALMHATPISPEGTVRFAALMGGVDPDNIQLLCERLRVPADYRDLARLTARFASRLTCAPGHAPGENLLDVFEKSDAFRRPERFDKLLLAAQTRVSVDPTIPAALKAANEVRLTDQQLATLKGHEIAIALHAARLKPLDSLYHR
jgi:tRNA nucleotidyltransferase (CCA-adding enzyme)